MPRPTAGLRHVCMCIQGVLVRRRAGGKHTSKAASCSAHSPGRRGPAFKMPFAQMQAPRSSAKKLATEIAGAKALERARRGGCCREERKAVCRRHGEPAQARPRPHRLEGGAARRAREERGVCTHSAEHRGDEYPVSLPRAGCRMVWMTADTASSAASSPEAAACTSSSGSTRARRPGRPRGGRRATASRRCESRGPGEP